MRKTARTVVWKDVWAQSHTSDPIKNQCVAVDLVGIAPRAIRAIDFVAAIAARSGNAPYKKTAKAISKFNVTVY